MPVPVLGFTMQPELTVIIVSWNVAALLEACLNSLLAVADVGNIRIIVVDNASIDGTAEMVRERFPQVELVSNNVNLGFTKANNQALALNASPYVLLLNPDTLVRPGALRQMLDFMRANPNVGLVGPRLVYGDGQSQPSMRRFPTLPMAMAESTPWEWHFPNNRLARVYRMLDEPADAARDVDWVTGACMLIRYEVVGQVGMLDERFFMYSEELDWCRRIAAAGWRIVYLPSAVVVHLEGQSSGQVVAARHIRFNTSKVLYFFKHHGRLQAECLRLSILLMYGCEWLLEALKYVLGHKREMRLSRLDAYRQVLRSGLHMKGML